MKKLIIVTIALLFSFTGVIFPSAYADTWTQKADYGGTSSNAQTGLSIGEKGYVWERSTKLFWEYDPAADGWSQKTAFEGTIKSAAVGFSIDSKGYMGTGLNGSTCMTEFWEYDPSIDVNGTWTQKTDFTGNARYATVAFSIGSKGYIGTGYDNTSYKNDFWEYDPAGDAWTQMADFGGVARGYAVGFSIDSLGFIGTGSSSTLSEGTTYYKDFWEYDPAENVWTQRADFGGPEREWAVGFAIDNKGYIGTGHAASGALKDFWEYDPGTDTWISKTAFGGDARYAAVAFVVGSKGYIGTGYNGSYLSNFWEYDPRIRDAQCIHLHGSDGCCPEHSLYFQYHNRIGNYHGNIHNHHRRHLFRQWRFIHGYCRNREQRKHRHR